MDDHFLSLSAVQINQNRYIKHFKCRVKSSRNTMLIFVSVFKPRIYKVYVHLLLNFYDCVRKHEIRPSYLNFTNEEREIQKDWVCCQVIQLIEIQSQHCEVRSYFYHTLLLHLIETITSISKHRWLIMSLMFLQTLLWHWFKWVKAKSGVWEVRE